MKQQQAHARRVSAIRKAVVLADEAAVITAGVTVFDCLSKGKAWKDTRKAARKFEKASWLMGKAGLGAASKKFLHEAATCWEMVGESGQGEQCRQSANEIDVFYVFEEEESHNDTE